MNKKIIKISGLVVLLITISIILVGCNDNDSKGNEKITFVLDWTPNTNHTGLYVAIEEGYFAEEGIEVEVVQGPENGAEPLVASNQAQFGVSYQDTLAAALVGDTAMPVKAVAVVIQHNTSGIISRKGEGIDRPKGLMNKSYSSWQIPIEVAMVESVVEMDGGETSRVVFIPSTVTDEVSALKSKQTDAIWIYYAWAGIKTEVEGLECDFFYFKDINPVFDYYTPVIIANEQFLEEKPEVTRKFLKALKKGYEYAIDNPENAADILCKAAPELDKEIVLASQKWLADKYKAEVEQWGYIDAGRWNAFYNWLNENKLVEEMIPENVGFTNEYLE